MDNGETDINAEQLTITLPSNMLAQIDAQIGGNFVDRQDFLRAATRHYLEFLQSGSNATGQTATQA